MFGKTTLNLIHSIYFINETYSIRYVSDVKNFEFWMDGPIADSCLNPV